jgi:RNA polymerase sigma-70 factor (ECF subfamily)
MTNFSEIYAKNYTKVVDYITFRGIDAETAQDIAQDVFVKAMRLYESGNYNPEKSAISTWIRTIANSAIIDYYRTNHYGRNTTTLTEMDDDESDCYFQIKDNSASAKSDNRINRKDLRTAINKAMRKLNDREQVIAYLYFKRQCEYAQIAELTGFPMGTVKGLINRIREKLQYELSNVQFA